MSTATLVPAFARITELKEESRDVRTLRLELMSTEIAEGFSWRSGQFAMISVFGSGEAALTITNPPQGNEFLEITFREMGKLTSALRNLSLGQAVGVRGPYGNSFPLDDWKGRDVAFVGGGIGMAALHAPLWEVLLDRDAYRDVTIMTGARSAGDLIYRSEFSEWERLSGKPVIQVVDPGGETADWKGEVGLVPQVFERLALSGPDTVVVVCGPPIMLEFMLAAAARLGTPPSQLVTTLENRMKCGLGYCGHCNVGSFMVCRDGPVVTGEMLAELPKEF